MESNATAESICNRVVNKVKNGSIVLFHNDADCTAAALPAEWKSIKIDKVFRGKKLHITVLNPDAKQGKVTNCVVNGEKLDGYRIPVSMLKDENEIVVNY